MDTDLFTVGVYDIIQLVLLLGACYGCYFAGRLKTVDELLNALEEDGIIVRVDEEDDGL